MYCLSAMCRGQCEALQGVTEMCKGHNVRKGRAVIQTQTSDFFPVDLIVSDQLISLAGSRMLRAVVLWWDGGRGPL